MNGLTATTGYTVYVQSVKGNKTSEWSNIHFTTLEESEMALCVPGYGDTNGGWAFIASPVVDDLVPSNVTGLLGSQISSDPVTYNYDLYRFNQSGANGEWENYHQHNTQEDPFRIVNGQGYLYASKEGTTLKFTGTFNTDASKTITGLEAGYHLVGNPFAVNATINKSYYTLDETGSSIVATPVSGATVIAPCTGVIVQTVNNNTSVIFTAIQQQNAANNNNNGGLQIALTEQVVTRGGTSTKAIDNAIVSFNEGSQLGKFYFGRQNANIYIPQNGEEYAIVNIGRKVTKKVR